MSNFSEVDNFNASLLKDIANDLTLLDVEFNSITVIEWLVIVLLSIIAAITLCVCARLLLMFCVAGIVSVFVFLEMI